MLEPIKKIAVVAAQYDNGWWYATCPGFPWLAAEGETRGEVVQAINQIAPALLKDAGVSIPHELAWRVTRENE